MMKTFAPSQKPWQLLSLLTIRYMRRASLRLDPNANPSRASQVDSIPVSFLVGQFQTERHPEVVIAPKPSRTPRPSNLESWSGSKLRSYSLVVDLCCCADTQLYVTGFRLWL
jgi:hypothetical protein